MTWAQAIGAIAGAALSMFGEKKGAEDSSALQYHYQTKLNAQNFDYNTKLINMQNAFNEAMMDKANIYNTEMWNKSVEQANTAHQREVQDLRAAGLNPVLSANGGASVVNPVQSAQASSGNSQLSSSAGMPDIDYTKALSSASSIYQENRRVNNELNNSRTAREFQRSQTANTYNQMDLNTRTTASEIAKRNAEVAQIKQDIKNSQRLTDAQVRNYAAQTDNYISNSAKSRQEISNLRVNRTNAAYETEQYKRQSDWIKKNPGQAKWTYGIGQWTGAIGNVFRGSASASSGSSRIIK